MIKLMGGTHMLRYTGMYCGNGIVFHKKFLDIVEVLSKKSLEVGPISQKFKEKKSKISYFVLFCFVFCFLFFYVENPKKWDPICENWKKKTKKKQKKQKTKKKNQ